jgi:hypothetical protein
VNVDTGEFRALTEQVGALGRKVSALTGRTTVMGDHLNRLDGLVEDELGPLVRTVARLAGADEQARRGTGRHATPRGKRHLRAVDGKT